MPETTRDRCITPSFSPSTYHHGKLMDGELCDYGSFLIHRSEYLVKMSKARIVGFGALVGALIKGMPGQRVPGNTEKRWFKF
jgi:hypothetical protein